MKPITDDVVYSIMQGLERRERRQKVSLERTKATLSEKILGFEGNRRIISLDFARKRTRRTVSGVFCYVARG